jgi:hypothetical protein
MTLLSACETNPFPSESFPFFVRQLLQVNWSVSFGTECCDVSSFGGFYHVDLESLSIVGGF